MARLNPLTQDVLDEEQLQTYEKIVGRRGELPLPMGLLIRSPKLAEKAQQLGQFLRFDSSLPPRLSELAIMVTARVWTSQYEWAVHKKAALAAGLTPEILQAIAEHQTPTFTELADQVVYEISLSIQQNHTVSDELYRKALDILGERGLVDLIGVLGFYNLISITLNMFEIDVPEGTEVELA